MASLVAEKKSQALYAALGQFLNEFYVEFENELSNVKRIYQRISERTLPIVLRCLPFLDSDEVISLVKTKDEISTS